MNNNPYSSPRSSFADVDADVRKKNCRGPAFYIAGGCFLGILVAIAIANFFQMRQIHRFPFVLICLAGMPVGGLIYRVRSRNWPTDPVARHRSIRYALYSLALPACLSILTGMRGQGLAMTLLAGSVALSFAVGALLAGARRNLAG